MAAAPTCAVQSPERPPPTITTSYCEEESEPFAATPDTVVVALALTDTHARARRTPTGRAELSRACDPNELRAPTALAD